MTRTEIERFAEHLNNATTFVAVFGAMNGLPAKEKRLLLSKAYRKLAMAIHPDRVPEADRAFAGPVFTHLGAMRDAAERAIDAGIYDVPFVKGAAASEHKIRSATATYSFLPAAPIKGGHSRIYRGSDGTSPVLIKISARPTDNARLEQEAALLGRFADTVKFPRLGQFVPKIVDAFWIEEGGRRYRVNVMPHDKRFLSVRQVVEYLNTQPYDPRDRAWICRRVLGQVLAAEAAGVVHGRISPDNVLVDPITHEPLHVGWSEAVPVGVNRKMPMDKANWRWLAPECEKGITGSFIDIYAAGVVMLYVFASATNGMEDVPSAVSTAIYAMHAAHYQKRPKDGRTALESLTRAIRAEWGTEYRPLHVPVS